MGARAWCVVGAIAASVSGLASAEPKPTPFDLKPFEDKLLVSRHDHVGPTLDVEPDSPVIFKDFGIYGFMGTLCENI